MDKWFHETAKNAQQRGTASVSLCISEDDCVVGFFALLSQEIRTVEMPGKLGGTSAAKDAPVSATLIGRLGLHLEHRGKQLGPRLVLEAVRASIRAADIVATRYIILDAKNEKLAAWYQTQSFHPFRSDPLRLGMKMSSARVLVEQADAMGL